MPNLDLSVKEQKLIWDALNTIAAKPEYDINEIRTLMNKISVGTGIFPVDASITTKLDDIASKLESKGYTKEASEIDVISNTLEKIAEQDSKKDKKGFVTDIEKDTKDNTNFRKVLYTGKYSQLVLMDLKPGEDIGVETHETVDQFFRIDDGSGKVIINGKEHDLKDGSAFVIPSGTEHNVVAGDSGLKLYTVYSPPNHADGKIHKTKEDAVKDEKSGNDKFEETTE